jgi:hypothetical protein
LRWRREINPVNLLLLAGIVFLLVATIRIWWMGGGLPNHFAAAKGPEVPLAPMLRDQQPQSAFEVVISKNLFSPDRNAPALKAAKVENSLEGSHLLGTMIIGDTRAAIIEGKSRERGKSVPEVDVVYLGEDWGGYKVLEISNDSVTFQGKDGRKTLSFPE